MNSHLFVYGTLLIPEIQKALFKKELNSQDAYLIDYSANSLVIGNQLTDYPFLKPCKGKILHGKILSLDSNQLELTKYYEGLEYELKDVRVKIRDEHIKALVFVQTKDLQVEFGPEWNQEIFVQENLNHYIAEIIPEVLKEYNL